MGESSALASALGEKQIMKESYRSIEKRCKKYLKLQDIGSNYYFWRPDRQFGKFRTGFGFIRVRIRGQEQLYVFYRAATGPAAVIAV